MLAERHRDIPKDMWALCNKGVTIIGVIEADQSLPQMCGSNIQESSGTLKAQKISENSPYRSELHLVGRQRVEGDDGEILIPR